MNTSTLAYRLAAFYFEVYGDEDRVTEAVQRWNQHNRVPLTEGDVREVILTTIRNITIRRYPAA